jgi:hemerythrin-like domain-containing protein
MSVAWVTCVVCVQTAGFIPAKQRKVIAMLPIGPLMIEHRLIERMIASMKRELQRLDSGGPVDPVVIDVFVDFIRTYADRCHHGKEEDILFRDLAEKRLSREHKERMDELIKDHRWGRKTTERLVIAKEAYLKGDRSSIAELLDPLRSLIAFYPAHIEKEDKHFFIPVMDYFSQEEKDAMLQEGYDFDKELIHEKYRNVVQQTEKQTGR